MGIRFNTLATLLICSAGMGYADDTNVGFEPDQLVGAWKLVSGQNLRTETL